MDHFYNWKDSTKTEKEKKGFIFPLIQHNLSQDSIYPGSDQEKSIKLPGDVLWAF